MPTPEKVHVSHPTGTRQRPGEPVVEERRDAVAASPRTALLGPPEARAPQTLSSGEVLYLQRTAGNRAVSQVLAARAAGPVSRPADAAPGSGPIRQATPPGRIQRIVSYKQDPDGTRHWYSTLQRPVKYYPTRKQAEMAERYLKPLKQKFSLTKRSPTFFSYTRIPLTRKMSCVPQGPHSAAHVLNAAIVDNQKTIADVDSIYLNTKHVPTPAQVKAMVQVELGQPSADLKGRIDRFYDDYETRYAELGQKIKNNAALDLCKTELLCLMEMNPYGTYAWKGNKKPAHKFTKGKGESLKRPATLIDKSARKHFVDAKSYERYTKRRLKLLDKYVPIT